VRLSSHGNPCGCGGRSIRSGFVGGSVNSVCHGFTGGVASHQSHVVPNPKIVFICWDQYFTDTPAAVTSLTQSGHDRKENQLSLEHGFRLMSVYSLSTGVKIWVITEADRSSTCVLLPEEY
jgi:hypothetical protein